MTLPGGPANKLGNRYERLWTVNQLLNLLDGQIKAIRLEEPSVDKVEFVVYRKNRREFHQVKRTSLGTGWTLSKLASESVGVLQSMRDLLQDQNSIYVFVSNCGANELSGLCEAAHSARTVAEFETEFLKTNTRRESLQKLCKVWQCDIETAIDHLSRVEVHTIDERELEKSVQLFSRALYLANERNVVAALSSVVDESIHRTIQRDQLVELMDTHGFSLRHVSQRQQAVQAVRRTTQTFIESARGRLIHQQLVSRQATRAVQTAIGEFVTVLVGRAGTGKTACALEIVEELLECGCQVLAFRLDRHVKAHNTQDLGKRLGFEESPVLILEAAAEQTDGKGVLLVDQLDAVSAMSGRSSAAFDLVESLLEEAAAKKERTDIHVIVVCRSFDWDNDHRLRQSIRTDGHPIVVDEFTEEETKTLLLEGGYSPALFKDTQLRLLRSPQNISLFINSGFTTTSTPAFDTTKELFDRYWDEKRKRVLARFGEAEDHWTTVLNLLCSEMHVSQELSVRKEILDNVPLSYLDQMTSEGVLTYGDDRYGFGHESFFDYCFARLTYLRGSSSLTSILRKSEQHLFRRGQVRQVLSYVRDADFERYLDEIHELLKDSDVRMHIKSLIFALLSDVSNPQESEWQILQEWTSEELQSLEDGSSNTNTVSALALRYLVNSKTWFNFLVCHGTIENWLSSDNDHFLDFVVNYLRIHQAHSSETVTELLEPFITDSEAWRGRLKTFVEWADLTGSRRLFDLFLRLIDNGTLDDARGPIAMNSTFWDLIRPIASSRPAWVGEVIVHRARRFFLLQSSDENSFAKGLALGIDANPKELFFEAATSAPVDFVEHVLPIVLEVSDSTTHTIEPPFKDAVWTYQIKTDHPTTEQACLEALTEAIKIFASTETIERCKSLIEILLVRKSYISNHLLLALYRGSASRFAGIMVTTVCKEPWRFECGFIDSPNWCARETISTVISECTPEERDKLETAIMSYDPRSEAGIERRAARGLAEFALISAIPSDYRSGQAQQRFQELERKFGDPSDEPKDVEVYQVESPINSEAVEKMSDDQWLGAITRYSSEEWSQGYDGITGGVSELSRALEDCVVEEPERFARLALQFSGDTNEAYMRSVLTGLSKVELDSNLKLSVCLKAFNESFESCGAQIADTIGSFTDVLSDEALNVISSLATEHPDPHQEEWECVTPDGGRYFNGEIYTYGINTVRGRAAIAIGRLILTRPEQLHRYHSVLIRMLNDQNTAVLSCVAVILDVIAVTSPKEAASMFLRMKVCCEKLLVTHPVKRLLKKLLAERFKEIEPTIQRMLRSNDEEVSEQGAIFAGLGVLHGNDGEHLVDFSVKSSASQRAGIAGVASSNLHLKECRDWCEHHLVRSFNDDSREVRVKAAVCFRQLDAVPLEEYEELIDKFSSSKAFEDHSEPLLDVLDESRLRLPGLTCLVCERLLKRLSGGMHDKTSTRHLDFYTLSKLIFRTYQQHQNDEWGHDALNLIDQLCLERFFDVDDRFERFER